MDTWELADCKLDLGRQRVLRAGEEVPLTDLETKLLAYFLAHRDVPISRDELLTEVWDANARNVTRAVDSTVMRLRRKIEKNPTDPEHLLGVFGVGYRWAGGRKAAPAAAPVPRRGSFLGREADRLALSALLPGITTIVGPPGMGKTRLALEILDGWPDARFCDLSSLRSSPDFPRTVLAALGMDGREADEAKVASVLASREGLLVIDNFEHRLDCAPILGRWSKVAPLMRFLVTSRVPLQLVGERLWALEPLQEAEAESLLLERARALVPGWGADAHNLRQIVNQLDRLPLAIELAAARAALLGPEQLLQRLSERFRLLVDPRQDVEPRHRTLRAAIGWSWELLTRIEQSVLVQCSLFCGPFSVERAESVVDVGDVWLLDVLESLRAKSLLSAKTLPNGDRALVMLESIRQFAAEQTMPGDVLTHRERFLRAMSQLVAETPQGPTTEEVLRWSWEIADLEQALEFACAATAAEEAANLWVAVSRIRSSIGPPDGGLNRTKDVLALVQDPRRWVDIAERAGMGYFSIQRSAEGRVLLEQALQMAERHQLAAKRASAHSWLAAVDNREGAFASAEAHTHASLAFAEQAGLDDVRDRALLLLGQMARQKSDLANSRSCLQRAIHGSAHRLLARANMQRSLGLTETDAGNFEEAKRLFEHALEFYQWRSPQAAGVTAVLYAGACVAAGELDQAAALLAKADPRELSAYDRAHLYRVRGHRLAALGEIDQAILEYDLSFAEIDPAKNPVGCAVWAVELADLYWYDRTPRSRLLATEILGRAASWMEHIAVDWLRSTLDVMLLVVKKRDAVGALLAAEVQLGALGRRPDQLMMTFRVGEYLDYAGDRSGATAALERGLGRLQELGLPEQALVSRRLRRLQQRLADGSAESRIYLVSR